MNDLGNFRRAESESSPADCHAFRFVTFNCYTHLHARRIFDQQPPQLLPPTPSNYRKLHALRSWVGPCRFLQGLGHVCKTVQPPNRNGSVAGVATSLGPLLPFVPLLLVAIAIEKTRLVWRVFAVRRRAESDNNHHRRRIENSAEWLPMCIIMGDTVSALLFQPPTPSKLKEHKIVWLETRRGKRIPGFYISYRKQNGVENCRSLTADEIRDSQPETGITLLYSHANAEDLGSIYPWCKFLSKMLQVNLFAYDYCGYGMAYNQGTLFWAFARGRVIFAEVFLIVDCFVRALTRFIHFVRSSV